MHLRVRYLTSFILLAAIVLSSVSSLAAFDEGMFAPNQIASLNLRQKGLKIKPTDIYDPTSANDISEAVISLSVGCTAEFVSPQGLILTNHHCGFDALVSASSPGKDYGKDGYTATSVANELPAKGYSLSITNRVEDVTARVKQGTENLSGDALAQAIKANTEKIVAAEKARLGEGSNVEIRPVNSGVYYYLYGTTQIKDVRVVYAPPQMIGFYGGDPDNFEWSRHTGDFTFLRAYVAPDGKAAEYSPNNVPYKPKRFLTISLDGVKENDFTFVMGYPGGTTRFRESQFVDYSQKVNFPFLAGYLTAWGDALREVGETDEAKRVALQGEIANIDNGRKLYEGGVTALTRSNFVETRRAEETRFAQWVNQNPQRKAKYGEVLANLDRLSKDFYAAGARDRLLRTFPKAAQQPVSGYAPVYGEILDAVAAVRGGRKLDDATRTEIENAYKSREPVLERAMLRYFLKAASELPAGQKFEAVESVFGRYQGKARRDAEEKFINSILTDNDFDSAGDIADLYEQSFGDLQRKYPDLVKIAAAHVEARSEYGQRAARYNADIDRLRVLYQQGMMEMKGGVAYPDANFTQRFTYGYVKGYTPREAVIYTPFTTLKGVIEKDTGVFPFDVPEKLKELQKSRDFGRYGVGDSVPVNFLATTDIIGGNSGSPIMNANGEQVGIIFDGNYEGLGNDIFFDANYGRSIAVDIRYVLFVTEKFAGAGWILKEMNIKGGAKTKAAGK